MSLHVHIPNGKWLFLCSESRRMKTLISLGYIWNKTSHMCSVADNREKWMFSLVFWRNRYMFREEKKILDHIMLIMCTQIQTQMCVCILFLQFWGSHAELHPAVLTVEDAWRRVLGDHRTVLLITIVSAVIQLVADQWAQAQTIPIGALELALCRVKGQEQTRF